MAKRKRICNLETKLNFVRPITICLILLLGLGGSLRGAHLVGGELTYRCLGNNDYEVKLTIYRDCASSGAPFDDPAILTIYDGAKNFINNYYLPYENRGQLPVTAPNNCTSLPSFVCTEKGIYRDTVNLPPSATGYSMSYQRCCRNATISNIPASGTWGNTYTADIPPNDTACNSSPSFNSDPPVALCRGLPVNLDLSVSESDGDSIRYSLCSALHGGGNSAPQGPNSPRPDTAQAPPYQQVPFSNGYSATNPINSSPSFAIDPQSGILSGRPTLAGQFVFAICVREFRNGQLVSTIRRDFQFNVTNACTGPAAVIAGQDVDSSSLCTGKTVTFRENSLNSSSLFWDFGDPNNPNDTSSQASPTYTYSDTGTYRVMLVADPGGNCSDTAYADYRVYDSVSVSFQLPEVVCYDSHQLDLNAQGNFSPNADLDWNFGGATSAGFSAEGTSLSDLRFDQPGRYIITLRAEDFRCSSTFRDTIKVAPRPQLKHSVPQREACVPATVHFRDSSQSPATIQHYWEFGDGTTSRQASPSHTYRSSGTFSIYHRIISPTGCGDTVEETFSNQIQVYESPRSDLQIQPRVSDIHEPIFELRAPDSLSANEQTITIFPNGREVRNLKRERFEAPDTGYFYFLHISQNNEGCSDTLRDSVYVEQPIHIFMPDAFTPNGDGTNDKYKYVVTGVAQFELRILNRWGEIVYIGDDTQEAWDGRDLNGQKVPQGSYSYVLIADIPREGRVEKRTGSILVIR